MVYNIPEGMDRLILQIETVDLQNQEKYMPIAIINYPLSHVLMYLHRKMLMLRYFFVKLSLIDCVFLSLHLARIC